MVKSSSGDTSETTTPQATVNVNRRHISRELDRTGTRRSRVPCVGNWCATIDQEEHDVEAQGQSRGQTGNRSTQAVDSSHLRLQGRSRPSLENCGFARAMMKQMPSKMAISASGIASLGYGRSAPDVTVTSPGDKIGSESYLSATGLVRAAPSLIRYEKDVNRLADIVDAELRAQKNSLFIEDRKITRLRELPVSLTVKRQVRHRLEELLTQRLALSKQTRLQLWAVQAGRALVLMKRYLAEVHDLVHIWHEQLKTIEGNYGQNVGLYFRFMRWLLVVNLEVLLISLLFLVVPQLVLAVHDPDAAKRSALGMPDHRLDVAAHPAEKFSLTNLLTGQGWLYSTPMYYGYYYRGTIQTSIYSHYHMPSAYLVITTLCITYQLMMLASSTARSYRKNFIDVSTDTSGNIANLILAGWDARVTSEELAELKRTGLYQAFQRKLKEEEEAQLAASGEDEAAAAQRRRAKLYTVLGRLASNLLVLAVLCAVGALTWNVMSMDATLDGSPLSLLASAFMISSSMALFPLLFQFLGILENFKHPRALMFITLIRMVLMAIIILGTIVVYWVQKVNNRDANKNSKAREKCWENEVGSELYQLMIVDLFFTLVFEIGLEYARKIFFQHGRMWVEQPHFDIPRSTMFLIYGQTLVWTGAYFSPVLSLIGSAKLAVTFYVRKWSMERNCTPQSRSVRASQTQTLFRVVAFIVCFLAACFTGYIVTNVHPSESCGPFQRKSAPSVVVNDTFKRWKDEGHTAPYIMAMYSSQPGVVAVWMLIFSVVAYYLRSLALARQEMIVLLRGQLMLEGQDKVMLLQLIDDAASKLEGVQQDRPDLPDVEEEEEEEQGQTLPAEESQAGFRVLLERSPDADASGSTGGEEHALSGQQCRV